MNYANVIPLLQLADKYNVRDLLKVNHFLCSVILCYHVFSFSPQNWQKLCFVFDRFFLLDIFRLE